MEKGELDTKYRRSTKEVLNNYSFFLFTRFSPDLEEPRLAALMEVLRRIPEEDLNKLEKLTDTFQWYIPYYETRGECMQFICTHPEVEGENSIIKAAISRVIYLSPRLNNIRADVIIATVAHELAHIFYDHKHDIVSQDEYWGQEKEAWDLIDKWGFDIEAKAHEEHSKKIDDDDDDDDVLD